MVDEYGALSGLVTTEELLEELVGEIEDELDIGEPRRIKRLNSGGYLVNGKVNRRHISCVTEISKANQTD